MGVLLTVPGSRCSFWGLRVHLCPLSPSPMQPFWTVQKKLLSVWKTLTCENAQARQRKGVMGPPSGLGLTAIVSLTLTPGSPTMPPPGAISPLSSAAPACPWAVVLSGWPRRPHSGTLVGRYLMSERRLGAESHGLVACARTVCRAWQETLPAPSPGTQGPWVHKCHRLQPEMFSELIAPSQECLWDPGCLSCKNICTFVEATVLIE